MLGCGSAKLACSRQSPKERELALALALVVALALALMEVARLQVRRQIANVTPLVVGFNQEDVGCQSMLQTRPYGAIPHA